MNEHSQVGNAPDPAAYHDLLSLKARGWTARLIRQFLGDPDDTDRTRAANTGRPKNLYCAERVALVELHDSQFRAERGKAAMYSGRLKQTQDAKKKNLVAIVDAMALPDFDFPLEELLGQSILDPTVLDQAYQKRINAMQLLLTFLLVD